MKHDDALTIAKRLLEELRPWCDRIEIGGSIRRGKPEVKDIEIVAIPRCEVIQSDLFGATTNIYPVQSFLHDRERSGEWVNVKGREKYFQYILSDGINLDLFFVTPPAQWGVVYVLRTGPTEFNHWLVTSRQHGGCLPAFASMSGAGIYDNGRLVNMPEEISFLNFLGLGWIEPKDRIPHWQECPIAQFRSPPMPSR